MTDDLEKQKEEFLGWAAWHSEKGIQCCDIPKTKTAAIKMLCLLKGYYEEGGFYAGQIDPDEAQKDGWKIRPCKIVFTDVEEE